MKVITKQEAIALIKDGDVVGMGGFAGNNVPETLAACAEEKFLAEGHPRDLTLMFSAGIGDSKTRGSNHFGNEGMVKRVIGGHYGLAPRLGEIINKNVVEAYNLPQGVVTHLFRAAAGKKPGVLSTVGLKTFVDPRVEGGKLNTKTTEDIIRVMEVDGKEFLFYKAHPLNVALIRGTYADQKGNVTLEHESVLNEVISIAGAAKANGGIVIVEVERVVANGCLDPRLVKVPGLMVDYVVIGDADKYKQTWSEYYNPGYTGEIRVPMDAIPPMALTERKVIARRAAMELVPNSKVNLGIGMPEGVAAVAAEEGCINEMTLTVESGGFGGVAASGSSFGATTNAEAMIDHSYMFDFYDGGNLDMSCLGLAEVDSDGNLNVSKFGPKLPGCGGFINISQNAKKMVFCGTMTAGGLKVEVKDGKLNILQEGRGKKFVSKVQQITFSGKYSVSINQPVLFITERAVFTLTADGLVLTEVAPGVDVEKDVLAQSDAKIIVSPSLKLMDARIFSDAPMNLAEDIAKNAK